MEICKFGSISQAAGSLFISQQGLSSAIRRLEQELGCDLFYRKGNSLVLTEHGQYFLDHAADLVSSFDTLQEAKSYLATCSFPKDYRIAEAYTVTRYKPVKL